MYTISQRLKEIAGLVTVGSRVADIGADHGYLSIYLVKEGIASFVYTCDIGEGPLNNARRNIEKSGVKNIELRLCDGLDGIDPESVDTVIIAGMGGDVISGIIERVPWIKAKNYTLILQPMPFLNPSLTASLVFIVPDLQRNLTPHKTGRWWVLCFRAVNLAWVKS